MAHLSLSWILQQGCRYSLSLSAPGTQVAGQRRSYPPADLDEASLMQGKTRSNPSSISWKRKAEREQEEEEEEEEEVVGEQEELLAQTSLHSA